MGHTRRMTRGLAALALIGFLIPAIAGAQERQAGKPETDRTIQVTRGARLTVSNDAGEVVIRTWDRDSLRVRASHSDRIVIDIQTSASLVGVRARSTGGRGSVDYEITAPVWMPVKVSGQFLYIGIEGAQNEISAETVRGDIVIKGGSGTVTAKSIHGEIIVEGAKGRINLSSVNEAIRVTGASGEIVAETTNGDITLSKIEAKVLDISTVNGDLQFEGGIPAGAIYRFATHNGDIMMVVPESAGATFTVRTYNGDFQSNLATKAVGEVRRGRRATYVLGNGGADVELESFGGTIRLRRPGTAPGRRSKDERAPHSARSAMIGSIRAARSAGAPAAAAAVRTSTVAIAARVQGSHGSTRKSMSASS